MARSHRAFVNASSSRHRLAAAYVTSIVFCVPCTRSIGTDYQRCKAFTCVHGVQFFTVQRYHCEEYISNEHALRLTHTMLKPPGATETKAEKQFSMRILLIMSGNVHPKPGPPRGKAVKTAKKKAAARHSPSPPSDDALFESPHADTSTAFITAPFVSTRMPASDSPHPASGRRRRRPANKVSPSRLPRSKSREQRRAPQRGATSTSRARKASTLDKNESWKVAMRKSEQFVEQYASQMEVESSQSSSPKSSSSQRKGRDCVGLGLPNYYTVES